MAATLANIAAYLKESYHGPIREEVNQEAFVATTFKRRTVSWAGNVFVIVAHVARNVDIGFVGDGGALPNTGGNQAHFRLTGEAIGCVGRFEVTEMSLAAAKKNGAAAFASALETEVKGAKNDVVAQSDFGAIFGGRFRGVLNEHKVSSPTTGNAAVGAPAAGIDVWEYAGDFTPFAACVQANDATWQRVQLYRADRNATLGYAQLLPALGANGQGAAATNPAIFVSAIDAAAGTVTLSIVQQGGAAARLTTATVDTGRGIALALHATQYAVAGPVNFGTITVPANNPTGIFGNLLDPTHWTVDRTSATGTATALQSSIMTQTATGNHARAPLSQVRLQALMDDIHQASGGDADLLVSHPSIRSLYSALMVATQQTQMPGKKADLGFMEYGFGGVPIKLSQRAPRGAIIALKQDSWVLTELSPAGLSELDGSVLKQVANTTAAYGYVKWFYNHACADPNKNGMLVGFDIA